jgi:DNA-binding GntR family transcriptional regulator
VAGGQGVAGAAAPLVDRLREGILTGEFPPASRLVELQLAERFAVSRASVRAAIAELDKEGLVDREANRGATVRSVSLAEAIQITEVRTAVESLIAARAATDATPDERAELLGIVDQMRAAVEADQAKTYSELNATFHRRIREISGHTVGAEVVENLRNRAAAHDFRLALVPGRPRDSVQQHAAIAEAIAGGDAPGADAAMRAHLHSVMGVLKRWDARNH